MTLKEYNEKYGSAGIDSLAQAFDYISVLEDTIIMQATALSSMVLNQQNNKEDFVSACLETAKISDEPVKEQPTPKVSVKEKYDCYQNLLQERKDEVSDTQAETKKESDSVHTFAECQAFAFRHWTELVPEKIMNIGEDKTVVKYGLKSRYTQTTQMEFDTIDEMYDYLTKFGIKEK